MTIHLARPLPAGSSCLPGPAGARRPCGVAPARGPYSALLPVGLAMRALLPAPRWALTPPFHPCRCGQRRSVLCGAFPGVTPAGRYPAPSPHGVRTFLDGFHRRGHPTLRARLIWRARQPRSMGRGPVTQNARLARGCIRKKEDQTVTIAAAQRRSSAVSGPRAHGRNRRRNAARRISGSQGG